MRKYRMRIFITGGGGFVGSAVFRDAASGDKFWKKHTVTFLTRDASKLRKERNASKNVEIVQGSWENADLLEKCIKNTNAIVHIAGSTPPADKKQMIRTNVEYTKRIIELAQKWKVKKVIFLSSERVLAKNKTPYSMTKQTAEKIVSGFKNHLILRPALIYGEGDNKNLSKLARIIRRTRIVPVFGDGKAIMQPIYVHDVVKYVRVGLQKDIKGTFIVVGKERTDMNKIIDMIARLQGKRVYKIHLPLTLAINLVRVYERFSKKPIITVNQIKNMNESCLRSMEETNSVFGFKPCGIQERIRKVVFV
ncbi:NAD-dependent epimerase/dehydratase family protein [Candidatus Woesearchaeota archaeon]|nr:NAD-dependent epimerase/dehydratase family protein [Candidatus Woesearchaeota archaeon]